MFPPDTRQYRTTAFAQGEGDWHGPLAVASLTTIFGALLGFTIAGLMAGSHPGAVFSLLPPVVALGGATLVYGRFRHRRLGWPETWTARAVVVSAGVMMLFSLGAQQPRLVAITLWWMTLATLIVTALAAGARARWIDDVDDPLVRRLS